MLEDQRTEHPLTNGFQIGNDVLLVTAHRRPGGRWVVTLDTTGFDAESSDGEGVPILSLYVNDGLVWDETTPNGMED